jgi:hypothetical protein
MTQIIGLPGAGKTVPVCDACGGHVMPSMLRPGLLIHVDGSPAGPAHRVRVHGLCGACSNNDHSRHRAELAGVCIGCGCEEVTK